MNLYKRGMIFITFLGSLVTITLIGVALSTDHWVDAQAKRTLNPQTSNGRINFGLFQGEKSLNVGYGSRTTEFLVTLSVVHTGNSTGNDHQKFLVRNQKTLVLITKILVLVTINFVAEFMKEDSEFLAYNYWLVTVVSLALALGCSIAAAIFSVINTATTPITAMAGIPGLYLWNTLTLFCQLVAVMMWTLSFYEKLQFNVLSLSDRRNFWTSDGLATLGISFWFVTAGIGVSLINLLVIHQSTGNGLKKKTMSVGEEKGNGAIMLY